VRHSEPVAVEMFYAKEDHEIWAAVDERLRIPLQNAPPLKSCTFDSFPGLPNGLLIDGDAAIQGVPLAAAAMRPYTIEVVCKKTKGIMLHTSRVEVLQVSLAIISTISQVGYVETELIYVQGKQMRISAIYDRSHGPLEFSVWPQFSQGLALDHSSGLIQV
jgi:hypothetical protein